MPPREIVLGSDSGTFWTGKPDEPWTDEPAEARVFASPRDAWFAALALREEQADYLEDSAVELHVRDPEDMRRTRRAVTTALTTNRPALYRRWRDHFGEPLPADLPQPSAPSPIDRPDRLSTTLPAGDEAAPSPSSDRGAAGADADVDEVSRDRTHDAIFEPAVTDRINEPSASQSSTLPAFVRRHFVRAGDRFYHRQTPDRLAFTARGETFRAEEASVSVATALVELAQSQGWTGLRVKGSKEFRRLVWAAATQRGLSVAGYEPSAAEQAMAEQEAAPASAGQERPRGESRADGRERNRPGDPLAGVLVAHGPAPFQHQPDSAPSYFVSLRDAAGRVATQWGLDLERAVEASGAAVGDQVQLARLGRQRVEVREPIRDAHGVVVDHVVKEADRIAWSVSVREHGPGPDHRPHQQAASHRGAADPVSAKVVEVFTAERLASLGSEDRVRFRALYDQARDRLQGNAREPLTPPDAPDRAPEWFRERANRGR